MLICTCCGEKLNIKDLDLDEHDKPKYCPGCGCSQFDFEYDDPSRAARRKTDVSKARRKQNICRTVYGYDYYSDLHTYSKNKIHCSCALCAAKTRRGKLRRCGPEVCYTMQDQRNIDRLNFQELEFKTEEI